MIKDNLFKNESLAQKPFEFNEDVSTVFEDMLNRSIPMYQELQHLITALGINSHIPGTAIYDLGCSHGITLKHLATNVSSDTPLIGIDASESMIKKAKEICKSFPNITFHKHDLNKKIHLKKSSVIILNLVLQFISPKKRLDLLNDCYNALSKDGQIILVEKTVQHTSSASTMFENIYHSFKEKNGYSKEEIANKKAALKTVLRPMTLSDNIVLLQNAGFTTYDIFYAWGPFVGIVCKKAM